MRRGSGRTSRSDDGYDADGNVSSILGRGVTQHFSFDSANRLSCAGTSPGACNLEALHYDVSGKRISALRGYATFTAYIGDDYESDRSPADASARIFIRVFGEVIASKRVSESLRQAGGTALVPPVSWSGGGGGPTFR
ncbi:MAG: hypothetical protein ACE5FL_12355 [Myxococcota bacterium]